MKTAASMPRRFRFLTAWEAIRRWLRLTSAIARKARPKIARNIRRSGAFVVNIVSEIEAAGFTTIATSFGDVPRIAQSPAALSCREMQTLEIGRNRIVMGEVIGLDIRDDLIDAKKLYIDSAELHAIGRMQGLGWYTKTCEMFSLTRIRYEDWKK
jgi:flavin reductase (DIM6/NTAB) family NADH-FMN oxidoreductase RutF